jgi:hypothetical protein
MTKIPQKFECKIKKALKIPFYQKKKKKKGFSYKIPVLQSKSLNYIYKKRQKAKLNEARHKNLQLYWNAIARVNYVTHSTGNCQV